MTRRARVQATLAAAAVAILALAAAPLISPVTAAEVAAESPEITAARANVQAYCVDLVDDSTTTRQRNIRADLCTMWTRQLADLLATPSPSPSASPSASATTAPPTSAPPTTTPPPTTSPPSPSPSPTAGPAVLRAVDGGPNFYAPYPSLPNTASFFPIGVWFESVLDTGNINLDKDVGLNTYMVITRNSDLALIRSSGMNLLTQYDQWFGATGGQESGWFMSDEPDMQLGPGAGYTHMQAIENALPAGSFQIPNYAKGILFWETDAEAARFVNDWGSAVSVDAYWMTDEDACQASQGGVLLGLGRALTAAECHRPSMYGASLARVRFLDGLDSVRKPIWGFVEVGCPWSGGASAGKCMPAASIRPAVWHQIIAGARGVTYFNHSFSGSCQSQHVLRESCYAAQRAAARTTNLQVAALAPVINAPFVDGVLATNANVRTMVKWSGGHLYVFAASHSVNPVSATFALPCVGDATATVLDEGRSVPIVGGSFTDTFADMNAVHIYRIDGGGTCGL